jgi:hypothetical protein
MQLNTEARLVATRCNVCKPSINNLLRVFPKFSCSISTLIPDCEQFFRFTQNRRPRVRFFSMPPHDKCDITHRHTQHVFIKKKQSPRPATSLPTAVRNVSIMSRRVMCTELPSPDTVKDLITKTGRTTRADCR